MTRVSTDPVASLQIQPPRNKSARDDAAPPRDDFAALVDDNRPRPAEPTRVNSGSKPDRPRANDRHDDVVKADSNAPAPDMPDKEPVAEPAPATSPATSDPVKLQSAKVEPVELDADSGVTAPPDATAQDTTAAVIAVATPQIVPQTLVAPIATPTPVVVVEAVPLSIAAAALAATTATVEAATPQKATIDLTAAADPMLASSVPSVPKPTAKSVKQTLDGPTIATSATEATTTATGPSSTAAATSAPQAVKAEAQPAAKLDGTPADTFVAPAPHERLTAAPLPTTTDTTTQTFALPQHGAAPTATTLATAAPQVSIVASQTAPVPLNGLAMQIAATAISGKTSFDIRLDPAELGRIDVRLDVDRHGNVTSHLTVEKPETLAMLRQDAPQLQRALTDAGLQTSDKGLQFSLSDQSLSGQNNNPNGNGDNRSAMPRLVIAEDENLSIASAGRSYGRLLGSSSGVDIRI